MILEALGVSVVPQKGWISMSMAIEKMENKQVSGYKSTENLIDVSKIDGGVSGYTETVDGKGIKLQQVLRAGEGPAHCHEQWTTIVVPKWAVGKSYFFEVKNDSPLNLSCELFLDGEKVAFNSPLPPNSRRTIRPDAIRYFARHQWILDDAKRVKFVTSHNETPSHDNVIQPTTSRYNGIRPDYAGQRVSSALYPDPSTFGWRFTGSVQESRVEFFEKNMNIGGFVKLDFYYTTGTIKTVLHHPTSGKNQLFRAKVTPEQYIEIMKNPRAHTNQGYRRKADRPTGIITNQEDDNDYEFDHLRHDESHIQKDIEMEDTNVTRTTVSPTYFAKDEKYDFKKQGHQNRRDQMSKLQQTAEYSLWKEANKKEYAVVHAKFYVSIPKIMHYRPQPTAASGGFKRRMSSTSKQQKKPRWAQIIKL
ncbi:hypothetical protein ACHAW5_003270 [Stephanodiscus triporus]|uniref:Uncharacterized protein n=1 Tax=Stephanodiscus triporus TaxID=2934178 RepID=A0ABD3NVE2_9STRA